MARIDLTEANGWIPEESGSRVLTVVNSASAISALARKENMGSRTKSVPRFRGSDVDVVPEAGVIPEAGATLDEVVLTAVKFANRFRISEEDRQDGLVNFLDQCKNAWANAFARKLDNAALGVTGAVNGTTVPFQSVYAAKAAAGGVTKIQTTGTTPAARDLTFEDISNGLAALETGDYFDQSRLVVIAHPAFQGYLRNLKDSAGTRVVSEPLNGTPGSIFGYSLVYSAGARTSATATANPTGNPLLIMGNADHLILGVRSGPESQVTDVANWTTDEPELKMRARRGFVVADPAAFVVLEKTA